jgi:hypothetical protein
MNTLFTIVGYSCLAAVLYVALFGFVAVLYAIAKDN